MKLWINKQTKVVYAAKNEDELPSVGPILYDTFEYYSYEEIPWLEKPLPSPQEIIEQKTMKLLI